MARKVLFKTISHNGPVFPEPYKNKGYALSGEVLSSLGELMIFHWAIRRDTEYVKPVRAWVNFTAGLKPYVTAKQFATVTSRGTEWKDLINKIFEDNAKAKEAKKEAAKLLSKGQKEEEKKKKDELKAKYGVAIVDGKPAEISFSIEAPGPLITRGNDPRLFCFKLPVKPEDVTININDPEKIKEFKAAGFKTRFDPTLLSVWQYTIQTTYPGTLYKKCMFVPSSKFIQNKNSDKFGHSLDLLEKWEEMSKAIKDGVTQTADKKLQQTALIAYIIQKTSIRVGNEKSEDVADTVGASTLKVENAEVL